MVSPIFCYILPQNYLFSRKNESIRIHSASELINRCITQTFACIITVINIIIMECLKNNLK